MEAHDLDAYQKTLKRFEELVPTLPRRKGWMTNDLVQYQGFWLTPTSPLKVVILMEDGHFKPQPTDIFLSTFPKSGTTWLKALIFATINRNNFDFSKHPLLTTGPHDCFPFLDWLNFSEIESLPPPRLLSIHYPFSLLPESVTATVGCRFVYVCRDPKDVFVSMWLFSNKLRPKEEPPLSLEEAFEMFCEGVSNDGPFWDHVLGYWKASLESPDKILFLKYEEVKRGPSVCVKKMAQFLGQPFSTEEENQGVVDEIVQMCSFDHLSNLQVNKTGHVDHISHNLDLIINNSVFFRKGQVGDWKNHLTAEMIQRLDHITNGKLDGSGLTFDS
ncbi:hypothetical protein QYF36_008036 [Acer negundo]|nr:hypothetical protein QYF36_008036 [Acer negundo]